MESIKILFRKRDQTSTEDPGIKASARVANLGHHLRTFLDTRWNMTETVEGDKGVTTKKLNQKQS